LARKATEPASSVSEQTTSAMVKAKQRRVMRELYKARGLWPLVSASLRDLWATLALLASWALSVGGFRGFREQAQLPSPRASVSERAADVRAQRARPPMPRSGEAHT
jgi:hypothetical protein